MVQKTLAALTLLCPLLANAEVNLEFASVTIPEFAQTVLKGIIKKNYILSPDVLSDGRTITMSIKQAKEEQLLTLVGDILEQNGIAIVQRDSYLFLTRKDLTPAKPSETSLDTQTSLKALDALGLDHEAAKSGVTAPAGATDAADWSVYAYKPQFRELEEIREVLRFAGAEVSASNSNDIVFYKAPETRLELIQQVLLDLDKPSNEVVVKAFIYEVTNTVRDVNAISAAVGLLNSRLGFTIQNGQTQANQIKVNLPDIEMVISAFDSDNRFKQVSAPSLRVKNGKSSRFSVGTETPVIANTTQTTIGNPVQSIVYRPSGVILEITPRILAETIELDISQQLSSFVPTTTGVNQSPTLLKREIKTVVNTKEGELIMLGGLNESKVSKQSTGFGFLPKIFNSKNDQDEKSDILLIMQVQRL